MPSNNILMQEDIAVIKEKVNRIEKDISEMKEKFNDLTNGTNSLMIKVAGLAGTLSLSISILLGMILK